MNLISIICRDGTLNACSDELTICDYFSTFFNSKMGDNKQEIFLPFTKDVVINFIDFLNKNYDNVIFHKLKYIRKFLCCPYSHIFDNYDDICSYFNSNKPNLSLFISYITDDIVDDMITKNVTNATEFIFYIQNSSYIKINTDTDNILSVYNNINNHPLTIKNDYKFKLRSIILQVNQDIILCIKYLIDFPHTAKLLIESYYDHLDQLTYEKHHLNNNLNMISKDISYIIKIVK